MILLYHGQNNYYELFEIFCSFELVMNSNKIKTNTYP